MTAKDAIREREEAKRPAPPPPKRKPKKADDAVKPEG